MEIFLFNLEYMFFNLSLASIAVLFGYLMIKVKSNVFKSVYGFLWFIFLPNTIYILTDIQHLLPQLLRVNFWFSLIIIVQYGLFMAAGILTFIYTLYFFEKILEDKNKKKRKSSTFLTIMILNFIVGFGVILGQTQRTHSLFIFTDPVRVINDSLTVLYSPELLVLSLIFGIISNIIYFYFAKPVVGWGNKFFKI